MRKYTKYGMVFGVLFAVTLAFASVNNLGWNFANWGEDDPKEVPLSEIKTRLNEQLVNPISASLLKKNPHMFMTKCYSDLYADIRGITLETMEKQEQKVYDYETLTGSLIINNCGNIDQICKYSYTLSTNELKVRESYLSGWVTLAEFQEKLEAGAPIEE